MEIIMFNSEAYHRMMAELFSKMKNILIEAKTEAISISSPENDWITADEAKRLLGIRSKSRLQKHRNDNTIVYSKMGRKIKYSKASILNYLENNKKSNTNGNHQ